MKWIVYALLLINILYFLTQFLEGDSSAAVVPVVGAEIASNALVQSAPISAPSTSETEVERPRSESPGSGVSAEAAPSARPIQPVAPAANSNECVFLSSVTGDQAPLRSWLSEQGIAAEFIEVESVVDVNYLVVMPPLDSFDEAIAMQAQLAEKGFESFLLEDDYQNGLSIGYFSQRANAINYIARLENNGFKTELLEKDRRASTSWLKLSSDNAAKYRRVAATAQQTFGQINLQRNSCESVAF